MAEQINIILKEAQKESTGKKKVPNILSDEECAAFKLILQLLSPLASLTDELQSDNITSSLAIFGFIDAV
jgi:hypothetical protein